MFAEYTKSMFGEGVQSDVYTSLFSDAVAKTITERGGFGLGKLI
jgi:Rod binding domain-containing protein